MVQLCHRFRAGRNNRILKSMPPDQHYSREALYHHRLTSCPTVLHVSFISSCHVADGYILHWPAVGGRDALLENWITPATELANWLSTTVTRKEQSAHPDRHYGRLQVSRRAVAQEAERCDAFPPARARVGVPPAAVRPPRVAPDAPGQGAPSGIQGEAGLRRLPRYVDRLETP